jgi:hypothetical protein
MEKAAVAHDVERRRLLAMERAQAFVRITGFAERYGVRDDRDNVSGRPDFVDEGLREFQEAS